MSIDSPVSEDNTDSLVDIISDPNDIETDTSLINESLSEDLQEVLSCLSDKELQIINMYFGLACQEMDLEKIGEKLGITKERVRQIKDNAIKKIRSEANLETLQHYFG